MVGGPAEPLQAVLTGGYGGTWIPLERVTPQARFGSATMMPGPSAAPTSANAAGSEANG
jgi:hypothetical protein